jgi:vitamin B12 transporter
LKKPDYNFSRFLLVALFFWCPSLLAQSTVKIHGYVLDADNGSPLSPANVQIVGTTIGSTTDQNGRFEIGNLFEGDYSLEVTFIGYESVRSTTLRVRADRPVFEIFRLKPAVLPLRAVSVSAEQYTPIETDNIITIGRQDILRSNARDLGELLKSVGGIEIKETGGAGSRKTISIRGGRDNQTLVLLDGIRLNDELTGQVDLSTIPVSAVQKIEIKKGSFSAEHGSGAIAGVIDIVTRSTGENELGFRGDTGDFGSRLFSGSLGKSFGDAGLAVHYEKSKSNGDYDFSYTRPDGTTVYAKRLNSWVDADLLFAKLDWHTGAHHLQLTGQKHLSSRGLPGQIYQWTPFASAGTERQYAQLHYEGRLSGGQIKAAISLAGETSDYINEYENVPAQYRIVSPYHNRNELQQRAIVLSWEQDKNRLSNIAFQLEGRRVRFEDKDELLGNSPTGLVRTDCLGADVQHTLSLKNSRYYDEFTVRSALRFDRAGIKHDGDDARIEELWSPGLSVFFSKKVGLCFSLFASVSKGFRLPTYADLFYQQYRTRGNPQLKPERSTSREITLSTGFRFLGSVDLKATRFDTDFDDMILWRMGSFATFSPVNTDARTGGEEFDLSWIPFGWKVHFSLNHVHLTTTNLSGERTTNGKKLPYRPERSTKLSCRINAGWLSIDYSARVVGERFITEANTVLMPAYNIHDLTAGMSWSWKRLECRLLLSLYNMFDASYQIIENASMPGREWRVGLQIDFR